MHHVATVSLTQAHMYLSGHCIQLLGCTHQCIVYSDNDSLVKQLLVCHCRHNRTLCLEIEYEYTNCSTPASVCDNITTEACKFDYDGSGLDYQILAGSAFNNVYPVAGLIMGPLADFISRKLLLAGSLFMLSVFTGVIGFAAYYWELVLLRMGVAIL